MKAERDQAGGWSSCSGERRWGLGTEAAETEKSEPLQDHFGDRPNSTVKWAGW